MIPTCSFMRRVEFSTPRRRLSVATVIFLARNSPAWSGTGGASKAAANALTYLHDRDPLTMTGSLTSASRFLTTTRHVCGHAQIEETALLRELGHKTLTQRCDLDVSP